MLKSSKYFIMLAILAGAAAVLSPAFGEIAITKADSESCIVYDNDGNGIFWENFGGTMGRGIAFNPSNKDLFVSTTSTSKFFWFAYGGGSWSYFNNVDVEGVIDMVSDTSGNLYMTNWGNKLFKYIKNVGVVSLGDTENAPRGIGWGPGRKLWVACMYAQKIQRFSTSGNLDFEIYTGDNVYPYDCAAGPDADGDMIPDIYATVMDFNYSPYWRIKRYSGVDGSYIGDFITPDGNYTAMAGIAFGPDQNNDGIYDIYFGDPNVGLWAYSGADGSLIRLVNNDKAQFVATYPEPPYADSSLSPSKTLIHRAEYDTYYYTAPGVSWGTPYAGWDLANGWDDWRTDPDLFRSGKRVFGPWAQGLKFSLTGLPAHTQLMVQFDLHTLGSTTDIWDGNGIPSEPDPDIFYVANSDFSTFYFNSTFSQDANVMQSYPNWSGFSNPGLTGNGGHLEFSWGKITYFPDCTTIFDHNSSDLTLWFGQTSNNESFYLGNLRIYAMNSTPATIVGSKSVATGYPVQIAGGIVSAVFNTTSDYYFYIQDADRTAGIKVKPLHKFTVVPGNIVKVEGFSWEDGNGERMIKDAVVTILASGNAPAALGMTNEDMGGGAVGLQAAVMDLNKGEAKGVNNIGLLIQTWGNINTETAGSPGFFYVDDGSGLADGTPGATGVRVAFDSPMQMPYATVTGISSCIKVNGNIVRCIRPVSASDIQTH